MVHSEKLQGEGPTVSIGAFHKAQREMIYFPYLVRKKEEAAENCPKIVAYLMKIVKFWSIKFLKLVKSNIPDV